MAKIKITKRTVEALKVAAKDYIAFDTDLPGFGVRVMPSGKRFFLVQYRRHGRTRRVMIGQFGIVTAELARREATIKLSSVRGADGDPAALRDADRQSTTMKELGERFLQQYVPVRCKLSTQAEYRRSVELFLDPFFAKQRVRSVTTADVAELHSSLSHIPYQTNRTLGAGPTCFTSTALPLKVNAVLCAITNEPLMRDRSVAWCGHMSKNLRWRIRENAKA